MRRVSSVFLSLAVALGLPGASSLFASDDVGLPELSDDTFDELLAEVLPDEEEREFEAIPWRPAFGAAVEEARERDLPLLLWAMNGHPLACT
jgi:hypothetical protein